MFLCCISELHFRQLVAARKAQNAEEISIKIFSVCEGIIFSLYSTHITVCCSTRKYIGVIVSSVQLGCLLQSIQICGRCHTVCMYVAFHGPRNFTSKRPITDCNPSHWSGLPIRCGGIFRDCRNGADRVSAEQGPLHLQIHIPNSVLTLYSF